VVISVRASTTTGDEEAVFHTVQQRVAECGLAFLAAKGSVGVEQEPPLQFSGVFGGGLACVELFQVVLGCRVRPSL